MLEHEPTRQRGRGRTTTTDVAEDILYHQYISKTKRDRVIWLLLNVNSKS